VAETPKDPPAHGRGSLDPERGASDAGARLAARLKQLLQTPGISDKDRKLVERNLQRLLNASHPSAADPAGSQN
jgi:hypothetical protein